MTLTEQQQQEQNTQELADYIKARDAWHTNPCELTAKAMATAFFKIQAQPS